jgi:hypothetical protein
MFLQTEMYRIWEGTTFNKCHGSWTTNMTDYKADFSHLQCLQAISTLDVQEAEKEIYTIYTIYTIIYAVLKLNTL